MSRIGRKIIKLPKGVALSIKGGGMSVKGPKGELSRPVPNGITFKTEGDVVSVLRADDAPASRANHGMVRAHLANMVTGVSTGWTRELEINGVGYKAEAAGDKLNLVLGHSHPINYQLPKGVTAKVEKNRITLSGSDKDRLGQAAAEIREFRAPEPYKGKGVKYVEEQIKRKVGKAGATASS